MNSATGAEMHNFHIPTYPLFLAILHIQRQMVSDETVFEEKMDLDPYF